MNVKQTLGAVGMMGVLLGAAPARALAGAQAAIAAQEPPAIVAQGDAILMLPADRAYVTMTVEGRAPKVADAQALAATAMTTLQATLRAQRQPADAIRTTSYSVQPQYDYNGGRQTLRGYAARHVLEVRVDDLARLADVIDAAGASGATGASSSATVNSVRFDLKDRQASELEALKRAVRDAHARAEAMAVGLGRAVGAVVRLQEQRSSSASPVFRASIDAVAAGGRGGGGGGGFTTPIEPGEIQVRAQVTLTVTLR